MDRWAVAWVLAGLAAAPALAQDAEPWPQKYYNPAAAEDDLVLPMPCGGAMAFRRVEVPSDGWLGDLKVVLGGADERFEFSENSRYAYVAGGFTDPQNPARRFYYLAKHETMQMQVDALGPDCPRASQRGRLPATTVSWSDAARFAEQYTGWLYANRAEALPAEDGQPGFLRLPTEEEWEFAARGGVSVSQVEFQDVTFPTPEGLHKYAWFAGSRSSNGKPQLTGLLRPNPLGLHDMLGNADEIVLEPFRLNKLSRLHGQAGGFTIKGGNYLTSQGDIRSAYRQEVAHFDAEGPNRVRTIGFRLAIAANVMVSRERLTAIREEWQELPASITVTSGSQPLDDPVAELGLATQAASDFDLRARLERLSVTVAANIASRNEQRDRAAKVVLRLAAFLGRKLRDDIVRVAAIRAIVKGREAAGSGAKLLATAKATLAASEAALEENFLYYADTLIEMVQDYPPDVLARQRDKLKVEFESRGLQALIPFVELYDRHAAAYRERRSVDREAWLAELGG